ncbi:MAG: hypothetical protein AB1896_12755, partial [Thermodesulfobacteriota bacterium]
AQKGGPEGPEVVFHHGFPDTDSMKGFNLLSSMAGNGKDFGKAGVILQLTVALLFLWPAWELARLVKSCRLSAISRAEGLPIKMASFLTI